MSVELVCKDTKLSLRPTVLMGVLNVTPDSFSDGGLWLDPEAAIPHAIDMVSQGAGIVDVGGESTRPGAAPVSEDDELQRVLPVIEALAGAISVPISIDTRKPGVAAAAIEAGASIVNDTSGEEFDPEMDVVAARTGAAIVIMHSRGTPATMKTLTDYDDVVRETTAFLTRRAEEATEAGVSTSSIALDPGIGFAKTPQQSLQLLAGLDELAGTGWPVVVGTSRKSFIGATLAVPEDQWLEGTAATVAWAVVHGAHVVRVHDVEAMSRVVRMTEAIAASREPAE
ncbi:MAG TPA: dihydropteroate synthase [Actinomycetota bacterium]|nr:dihydropteroate synthase [Actinomycetota bacterium]